MARNRGRRSSPLYITPAFELFPKSYSLVKKNFSVFALLYAFPLIIGLSNGAWVLDTHRHWGTDAPVAVNAIGNSTLPAYAWGGFGLAFIIAVIIAILLQIMTQAIQLQVTEGKKARLAQAWRLTKARGWRMLGLYILVGIITAIGFVLLIIPGIIMLRRYFVAPYVMLENEDIGIWEAMQKSAEITKRDSWSVYSVLGVMIIFSLFGALPLIGWIVAFALHFFYAVAPAIRYRELKRLNQ